MGIILQLDRNKTKAEVINETNVQLEMIAEIGLLNKIKMFIVEPEVHEAIWDYSEDQVKYPVWVVLNLKGDSAIVFSEYGFDFGNWGLISTSEVPFHFGMDFQWYPTLKEAFLDTSLAEELI